MATTSSVYQREPGETLAVVLYVVAWCVIVVTAFWFFVGLVTHYLPALFYGRPFHQPFRQFCSFYVMPMLNAAKGVLTALILFAFSAIITAINANTRQLRKMQEFHNSVLSRQGKSD